MPTPLDQLADTILVHAKSPLRADVGHAARRTLYNVLATAVGGAGEAAVDVVIEAAGEYETGTARVPGRTERLSPTDAALATGIAAHLHDFDDTHLRTVIHPGAVCLAALIGLQDHAADCDAGVILEAFAWGVEAQLRLGASVSPEHYDAGWHITGTCGVVGAAITAGLLLGLDRGQLKAALEWAVEEGVGNREGFGSMTKPFHPGAAAVRGLRAVHDALAGVAGPGDTLTGPAGFAARLAAGKFDHAALLHQVGRRWELLDNTFKPYPCGIVTHPTIEAAQGLRAPVAAAGGPSTTDTIRVVCHTLVPELTGIIQPEDGLQARFSTAHGIVAGLLQPTVGLGSYTDSFVTSQPARQLRSLVTFAPDPGCARDAAHVEVTTETGEVLSRAVAPVRGSLARPLTDLELRTKAEGLVDRTLDNGAAMLDVAARRSGPGYLRNLLETSCPQSGKASPDTPGRPSVPVATVGADADDHILARQIAEPPAVPAGLDLTAVLDEGARIRAALSIRDPRARSGELGATLVRTGQTLLTAAAVAPCVAHTNSDADQARIVALALTTCAGLADRLDVPKDRLLVMAATIAATAAHQPSAETALRAVGLAATQTTTVVGTEIGRELDARRVRCAVIDAMSATALAKHGFTTPLHPLTGRRGLISLFSAGEIP